MNASIARNVYSNENKKKGMRQVLKKRDIATEAEVESDGGLCP